jgi:hypothetical protein
VSEKVVNGFIGCELMNELRDGWLRGRVDGVFWEDEKLVVITEEEYERLKRDASHWHRHVKADIESDYEEDMC